MNNALNGLSFITTLHHKEIKKDRQCTSKLEPYEEQYDWDGLEFPVPVKKLVMFEKKNPNIAV